MSRNIFYSTKEWIREKIKINTSFFINLFVIISILIFSVLWYEKTNKLSDHLVSRTNQNIGKYNALYKTHIKLARLIFQTQINTKEVKDIFKFAELSSNEDKQIIRDRLYNKLEEKFILLKRDNKIRQLNFYLPNKEMFLRFNKPTQYGDVLRSHQIFREPLNKCEKNEACISSRFIFSLFAENREIGSVEVSFISSSMSLDFMDTYQLPAVFLILKDNIDEKEFLNSGRKFSKTVFKDFYLNNVVIKQEIKGLKILKLLSEDTIKIVNKKAFDKKSFSIYANENGIMTFIKIKDFSTDKVTGMLVIRDNANYYREKINLTYIIIFISICVYGMFIYFLHYRNNLEIKMKQNNKKLESIFKEAHSGIALVDLNGKILEMNNSYSKLLGYSEKELLELNFQDIRTSQEDEAKEILRKAKIYHTLSKVEKTCKTKDNREIHLEFSLTLLPSKDAFITVINSLEDKFKLKKLNDELKNFNDTLKEKVKDEVEKNREKDKQMFHQSRLAQMGEMISMIAHQWRQPLNAISATSTNLNFKARLNKINNEIVLNETVNINKYSQYLSATIDDFRNFFKPNKNKEEITFCKLIDSVLGIIEISIENKKIKLIQNLKCKGTFITYPNELKQVILNLIKNAEDVLLDKDIENPFIKISTYTYQDTYILEVEDNGGGVPYEIMDKIFDPYFSTKMQKDGTGLGLYMSKTIVEEHCGGELTLSNSSNGAIFKIKLKKGVLEND